MTRVLIACSLAVILISGVARAQEGYPLDGTWRGYVGGEGDGHELVVMIMKWDGENITGLVNPGRNSYRFDTASLDPESWTVEISATNHEGVPVHLTGVLKNIGSYHRYIEGTWSQDDAVSSIRLSRE